MDDQPAESTISFDNCTNLGAVNLRGTGVAVQDYSRKTIKSKIGENWYEVEINVTSVGGFLLAKAAAAQSRRKTKDWYDIAFVLLHNDFGGVEGASETVLKRFQDKLASMKIVFDDLVGNFENPECQGPRAYAEQMLMDHPEEDQATLKADAVLAVKKFYSTLYP